MGYLNEARGVALHIKDSCRQRSAEDRASIQTDFVAMDEGASLPLGRVAEHDDTSVEVGAAREKRLSNPEAGIDRPSFTLPGSTGRQQSGMNEVITWCDILHLRGPQELPVGRWNRFQPECEGGLEVG